MSEDDNTCPRKRFYIPVVDRRSAARGLLNVLDGLAEGEVPLHGAENVGERDLGSIDNYDVERDGPGRVAPDGEGYVWQLKFTPKLEDSDALDVDAELQRVRLREERRHIDKSVDKLFAGLRVEHPAPLPDGLCGCDPPSRLILDSYPQRCGSCKKKLYWPKEKDKGRSWRRWRRTQPCAHCNDVDELLRAKRERRLVGAPYAPERNCAYCHRLFPVGVRKPSLPEARVEMMHMALTGQWEEFSRISSELSKTQLRKLLRPVKEMFSW